jgi:hypothetical protein
MEVRVACPCEQTYAFDVEPVNGRMPVPVNCPACGADGTNLANEAIRQTLGLSDPPTTPAPPIITPSAVRVNRTTYADAPPPPAVVSRPNAPAPARFAATARVQPKAEPVGGNLALGVLGALLGAALGSGILYALSVSLGFKVPLFGTITGLLTGLGGRMLYRGTDSSLGAICAVISLAAVTGTLYLMFGDFMVFSIISIVVSASIAWRVAS